jgi:hypothetical protein
MATDIPQDAFVGLEHVRESGETNMFDFAIVQHFAYENEFHATVSWMEANRDEYLKGVFTGFEVTER